MTTRNALLIEQEQFFTEIKYNKGRYIDFLDTMARFHRYPLRQQISLFFHAAADGTAYAGRDIWERLGTTVKPDAVGVPILDGEKGREDVRLIFEAKDTLDYNREDIQARLWKFDEDIHGSHIAQIYPDGLTTTERIAAECKKQAHGAAEMEELVAATATYIVLTRMGLPAKEAQAIKIMMSAWPEPPYSLEGVLEAANDISSQILTPLGQWIRTEGRERNDAGLLHDDAGDGRDELGEDGIHTDGGGTGRDGDSRSRGVGTAEDAVHSERETEAVGGAPSERGNGSVSEEVSEEYGGEGNTISVANGGEGGLDDDSRSDGTDPTEESNRSHSEGVYPGGNLSVITDEDRDALLADGVNIISAEHAKEIMDHYTEKLETGDESDRGRFLVLPENNGDGFTAIDNQNGDCLKESFVSFEAAAHWLVGNSTMEEILEAFPEERPEEGEPSENTVPDTNVGQSEAAGASVSVNLPITEVIANLDFSADMSSTAGKRKVFQRNLAAIRLVKQLEADGRKATEKELELLRSYAGWGGIPEAFDPYNAAWAAEYNLLHSTLSDEEFSAARASALNAHYTPSGIVKSIYEGLRHFGFSGGNILEPSCGSGRFFDAMPQDMREKSHIVGIELDSLSSRIAAKAYPDVDVYHQGFESNHFAKGSFDVAIGNVPFGNYRVTTDPEYKGNRFLIHDYFLAKMLDEVRPGGLVVALTSKGTMDKQDTSVREYLYKRANLVGAIRLPDHTFKSAGTEATTDLLIFQKLEKERTLEEETGLKGWIDTENPYVDGKRDYDHFINEYFRHIAPDAILGKLAITSTAYGTDVIVEQISPEMANTDPKLFKYYLNAHAAMPSTIPENVALVDPDDKGGKYGAVYYERRLDKSAIEKFELTPDPYHFSSNMTKVTVYLAENKHPFGVEGSKVNGLSDGEAVAIGKFEDAYRGVQETLIPAKEFSLDNVYDAYNAAEKSTRNLAVGDLIQVNDRFFCIQPQGFSEVEITRLGERSMMTAVPDNMVKQMIQSAKDSVGEEVYEKYRKDFQKAFISGSMTKEIPYAKEFFAQSYHKFLYEHAFEYGASSIHPNDKKAWEDLDTAFAEKLICAKDNPEITPNAARANLTALLIQRNSPFMAVQPDSDYGKRIAAKVFDSPMCKKIIAERKAAKAPEREEGVAQAIA